MQQIQSPGARLVAEPATATERPQPAVERVAATPRNQEARPSDPDVAALQGLSLADASVTISSGRNLVADYVLGANNQLTQIRVIDQTTHQVVAESPPDSIARMQQEMQAYQGLGSQAGRVTSD